MIEDSEGKDRRIVTIFDDIYDLADCRSYYRAMHAAGFRTAHYASVAFLATLTELKRLRGLPRAGIVDFASGYGIAGALLRHRIGLDDVLARYQDPWFDEATPAEVIATDHEWYAGHRGSGNHDRYAGIDVAGNALAYAKSVGIFDEVFPENLQGHAPSKGLRNVLSECDLIVECGSVAHMLPGALDTMLEAAKDRRPWVISAPIRGNDSAEAIEVMRDHGLKVEVLDVPPFRHRRFADDDEQARAIANARARGHETDGYESTGYFHAQLYLARPVDEATPVSDWLTPVSG